MNWKKRLGVCGALTLLVMTMVPMLTAGAQVVTGEIDVQVNVVNGSAGTAQRSDFQFQLDGGTVTNFNANGVNALTGLDVSVPHTVTPVDFAGYTSHVDDNIPGITCTNVTIDPSAPTPPFCRITYTFIEPITTTTTTTTTTTLPATTTTGIGTTTNHGTGSDLNACTTALDPNLQPPGKTDITVSITSDASPQPHRGNPILLSGGSLTLNIPATLLQTGYNAGLIKNGDQVPSTITLTVAGSNTTQKTHNYVIKTTAGIVIKAGKAQPLKSTVGLADTTWNPTSGTDNVFFSEQAMKIVSIVNLPGIGKVTVLFKCNPRSSAEFVAVGATGPVVTTLPPTFTTTTVGDGGGTTPIGGAAGGASELPRTGSSPWPLFVVAAICIDMGLLAIAGAKRLRRPLHQS